MSRADEIAGIKKRLAQLEELKADAHRAGFFQLGHENKTRLRPIDLFAIRRNAQLDYYAANYSRWVSETCQLRERLNVLEIYDSPPATASHDPWSDTCSDE